MENDEIFIKKIDQPVNSSSSVFTNAKVPLLKGLHLRADLKINLGADTDGVAIVIQNHESGNKYLGLVEEMLDIISINEGTCGVVIRVVQNVGKTYLQVDHSGKREERSISFDESPIQKVNIEIKPIENNKSILKV